MFYRLRLQSASMQIVILTSALVLLIAVSSIISPGFLTYLHLTTILYANTMLGILALAQTLVILSGGLDMSIGSIYWISVMVGAVLMVESGGKTLLPAIICLLLGVAAGFINGVAIARFKIPNVVMTLAMMITLTGVLYVTTGGGLKGRASDELIALSTGRILGFPVISLVWILLTVLFFFVQKNTTFGWRLRALGSNLIASRCSGIRVQRIQVWVYMLSGLLASLSGLFYLGWARKPYQTFQSQAGIGANLTLESITAVVIGGTLFSGGTGGVERTFIGVLMVAILDSIMVMAGLGQEWKMIMHGIIIIIVVGVYSQTKKQ